MHGGNLMFKHYRDKAREESAMFADYARGRRQSGRRRQRASNYGCPQV
jgi:hypothetical protein